MRQFQGRGPMRPGSFGRLGDGTVVQGNAQGNPVVVAPNPVRNTMAIPPNAGGGLVQGRGLLFQYQTPLVASLANGATTQVVIQFDQNSTFNWLRTTVTADLAAATAADVTIPLVTIQMTDQGSGQSFMNAPIPLASWAGTAQLPYVLPTPQLIQPNASYIFAFSNYSAATTYDNLRIQLHGYRIFNSGQA